MTNPDFTPIFQIEPPVTIVVETGLQGPQGEQGPKGDPGDVPDFDPGDLTLVFFNQLI